ncbi:hypothetical protein BO70DRAFT_395036 [Aspergillus heteromorphus CBS 117.55]|uniref:Uncharacterized protein n=1 Tax=Aspergillus heteromorphus CBS 117.55 TaxID=1448321 RepID=A0A317WLK4_9EURO|nr:uncharacterized protein BO70DRAFT_395036 [Aspergillus heteromorphus CBS 117.55]PWY85898.1 hypothetical protein BO70DRAFT_395036 [Aspergillus heteromorphus CBS 117.55]
MTIRKTLLKSINDNTRSQVSYKAAIPQPEPQCRHGIKLSQILFALFVFLGLALAAGKGTQGGRRIKDYIPEYYDEEEDDGAAEFQPFSVDSMTTATCDSCTSVPTCQACSTYYQYSEAVRPEVTVTNTMSYVECAGTQSSTVISCSTPPSKPDQ